MFLFTLGRVKAPSEASSERAVTRVSAFALLVGGAGIGLGLRYPALAWVGLVLHGYALALPARRRVQLCALALSGVVASALRFAFLWDGLVSFVNPGRAHVCAVTFIVVVGLCDRLALLLALAFKRPTSKQLLLALPLLWVLSEHIWPWISQLEVNHWLLTQHDVAPVRHVLSWLGRDLTSLFAVFLATSVGVASAEKQWRWMLPALAISLVVSMFVPARRTDASALEGVVALRFDRSVETLAPLDATIVVWPEGSLREPLRLQEGEVEAQLRHEPMRGVHATEHVMGFINHLDTGTQNAVLISDDAGAVRWMRAKGLLFWMSERRVAGFIAGDSEPFIVGTLAPTARLRDQEVGILLCSELLDQAMVRRATPEGVTLLLLPAGDGITAGWASARELMVAIAQLTAAERSVSIARASWRGSAVLIGPDGRVLARSDQGHLHHARLD